MRRSIRAAVLAAALALAGCATPYRHYEGPELPAEKVAVLVSSQASATRGLLSDKLGIHALGTANVFVNEIDGKKKQGKFSYNEATAHQFEIHLLPGKHSLLLRIDYAGAITQPITINFVAEAGHRYFVAARIEEVGGKRHWSPVLVDETTNTLIHPRR
jgi:hypothetical protein